MIGGGFHSFVAWRYLMERRPPLHLVLVYLFVGIGFVAATGFGVTSGYAELGFVTAACLALAVTRQRESPWQGLAVAVVVGHAFAALEPMTWHVGGVPMSTIVLWVGAAMPLVMLVALACMGSRPIAALILGFLIAAVLCYALGWGLEWYFRHHHRGPPYNKLVKSMSNLHVYDEWGRRIAIGVGALLGALGGVLVVVSGRRRSIGLTGRRGGAIGWALVLAGVLLVGLAVMMYQLPPEQTVAEWLRWWALLCVAPLVLLVPLGVFRYFFTFFTTVSMSGVFVGSMALVVVLSVMSGFESDLRNKILGSNAHIRVTRAEGMMSGWRDVMEQVRGVRGVRGVTPYATTEVVLSANSNYATVVIKGIDPDTVGDVTELFDDIEGKPDERKAAVKRLYPLQRDPLESTVDETPDAGTPARPTVDRAPDDLPDGAAPIDFSGGDDGAADVDAGAGAGDDAPDDSADDPAPVDFSGDDAPDDAGADAPADAGAPAHRVLDPAPPDFTSDDADEPPPRDYSGAAPPTRDGGIELKDLIEGDHPGDYIEEPPEGGRLALLDGVLVGKELVKQLHLFTGQEVRLVSPLADPANPDATGTPIPFHRDYRIAGLFYTGMYEYDLKFVYVPLESLQDFIQIGDDVDGIEVRIDDPDNTGSVRDAIAAELGPDYKVQDWKELNRNLFSALKLEKIAMFLVLGIIIIVASFSIIGNLIMVVVEKGKEIALLKTLGASDFGVMRVFVMQGFFIGIVGTGAGVAEGLVICLLCKVFGFPINPDVYYISTLPIQIETVNVAMIAFAGLLISALATLYPAYMAARLRPAEGLRHD